MQTLFERAVQASARLAGNQTRFSVGENVFYRLPMNTAILAIPLTDAFTGKSRTTEELVDSANRARKYLNLHFKSWEDNADEIINNRPLVAMFDAELIILKSTAYSYDEKFYKGVYDHDQSEGLVKIFPAASNHILIYNGCYWLSGVEKKYLGDNFSRYKGIPHPSLRYAYFVRMSERKWNAHTQKGVCIL